MSLAAVLNYAVLISVELINVSFPDEKRKCFGNKTSPDSLRVGACVFYSTEMYAAVNAQKEQLLSILSFTALTSLFRKTP